MTEIGNIRKFKSTQLLVKNELGHLGVGIAYANNTSVRVYKISCTRDQNIITYSFFTFQSENFQTYRKVKGIVQWAPIAHHLAPTIINILPSLFKPPTPNLCGFLALKKKTILLKYYLYTIKFTHCNDIIQYFLVNLQSCTPLTMMQFQNISIPPKSFLTAICSLSRLPLLTPGNY